MLSPSLMWLALSGCTSGTSEADALRQAWLVDALVDDNRVWLARDTAPLQTKYERMADDPYDFMRGTASIFLADLARPGTDRGQTRFLSEPAATELLLAADPHPENLGTFRPSESPPPEHGDVPVLLLEINDLDGAHFGPYVWDLRRAAVGLAVLLAEGGCDLVCRQEVLGAWSEGWIDELQALGAGDPTLSPGLVPGRLDPVTADLLDGTLEDGWDRARLLETTELVEDGRRFRIDAELDDAGRGLLRLSLEERAQAERLMAAYPGPEGFRVLALARRYGQGVASMPAVRYAVLWDRGDPGPDDDALLTVREVVDPGHLPGFTAGAPALYDSNAQRVVQTHRSLWSRPDADPRLAGLTDGAMTFKVLTWSSFNDGYDHVGILSDLQRGRLTPTDLAAWADRLGRQLASMHARSPTASGADGLQALLDDVGGAEQAFVEERVRLAEHDLTRVLADHELFVQALDRWGPLLGAEFLD